MFFFFVYLYIYIYDIFSQNAHSQILNIQVSFFRRKYAAKTFNEVFLDLERSEKTTFIKSYVSRVTLHERQHFIQKGGKKFYIKIQGKFLKWIKKIRVKYKYNTRRKKNQIIYYLNIMFHV